MTPGGCEPDDYRAVRRLGRKTRLPEQQRAILWSIFEQVAGRLEQEGMLTEFGCSRGFRSSCSRDRGGPTTSWSATLLRGRLPSFSPPVAGDWRTLDTHTLLFRPRGYGFGLDPAIRVQLPVAAERIGGGSAPILHA